MIIQDYLKMRFLKNNHPKYHKYMNEWINNITDIQLYYFKKEMNKLIHD